MGSSAKTGDSGSAQGRPRDPAVDQAILRAAFELFIEHGIAGASIEKIAKQAGVAKTSIYRRWSSREALLAQAIEVARNATGYTIDLLERTSPRDFIKLLVEACEVIAKPEIRNLMARLIGSAPDYPKLLEVYRETYYLPRRLALVRALERVQTAGLLADKRRPRNARRHADRCVDAPPADFLSRREFSQRVPRPYDQTSSPSRLRCLRSQTTDDVAGGHALAPPRGQTIDNSSARRGNTWTWTCGTPLPAPRKQAYAAVIARFDALAEKRRTGKPITA